MVSQTTADGLFEALKLVRERPGHTSAEFRKAAKCYLQALAELGFGEAATHLIYMSTVYMDTTLDAAIKRAHEIEGNADPASAARAEQIFSYSDDRLGGF